MSNKYKPALAPVIVALAISLITPTDSAAQAVEEITVTARKKEESLQDVPLSIAAFSSDQLQQAGAINNDSVAALTVNFNTARQVGRRLDRPTIRGQAAAATGVEPNASYFIDGAFVSGSISTAMLGPVERVEILRGPQSAQFGRATFSGAVNYVTRRPTNELAGEVQARAGSSDTRYASGWISGPIVEDNLYFFGSAGWDKYGGEWENKLPADAAPPLNFVNPPQQGDTTDLGGTETKDFVGKLLWTPNDTAEVTLKLGYTNGDDDHYAQLIQEPGELNCYLPTAENADEPWYSTSQGQYCGKIDGGNVTYAPRNPFNPNNPQFNSATYPYLPNSANLIPNLPSNGDKRQNRFNLPDFRNGMRLPDFSGFFPGTDASDWVADSITPGTKRSQYRTQIQYDQSLGDWNVVTRAAYNKDNLQQAFDLDRTEQRFFGGTFEMAEKAESDDWSTEVRLESPVENALRGTIGLYYYSQDWSSRNRQFVGQGFGNYQSPIRRDVTNKAVFGSLEYDFSDKWTGTVEARYANDKKDIVSPFACGDDPGTPELEGVQIKDQTDSDSLTPRFTMRWTPTDLSMLYGLVSKGTKPAEFNNAFFRPSTADACESLQAKEDGLTRVDEEKAWTYEVGGKTSWFSNRLTTNLSLFYIDWENQSVFQTELVGGNPANVIRNAGKSDITGLEFETTFVITDNLTGTFGYGLADGEYKEYNDPVTARTTGEGLNPDGTIDDDANNVRGNQLPNSPKHSVVTSLTYTHGLVNDVDWFMRTDFMLDSTRQTSADNFTQIDRRKMWNLRGGLESTDWTLTAYVTNLLDEQTPTSVLAFPYLQGLCWDNGDGNGVCPNGGNGTLVNGNSVAPTPGRNFGVEVVLRYGD